MQRWLAVLEAGAVLVTSRLHLLVVWLAPGIPYLVHRQCHQTLAYPHLGPTWRAFLVERGVLLMLVLRSLTTDCTAVEGGAGGAGGDEVVGTASCGSSDWPACGACGGGGQGIEGILINNTYYEFAIVFGNAFSSSARNGYIAGGGAGGACCGIVTYPDARVTCKGGYGGGGDGYRGNPLE